MEWKEWKLTLGSLVLDAYQRKLTNIVGFIDENMAILSKMIKDLDDVRTAMACLEKIRENFIHIDLELIGIEETYTILTKFSIKISPEDIDKVDSLRFNFSNLSAAVSNNF